MNEDKINYFFLSVNVVFHKFFCLFQVLPAACTWLKYLAHRTTIPTITSTDQSLVTTQFLLLPICTVNIEEANFNPKQGPSAINVLCRLLDIENNMLVFE